MKAFCGYGLLAVLILSVWTCGGRLPTTAPPLEQQLLADEARIVMDSFAADPKLGLFRTYLKRAKGLLIIPNLYKGAWFLGGSGGRGVLMVPDHEKGQSVGPAFYTVGSVSLGVQFGGEKSEVIVLVMTEKGLEKLYSSSVKIGVDASGSVGPYGGGIQGATAPSLKVDYIAFARSKGVFLGVSLDGAIIDENYEWNRAYYGRPVRPLNIFVNREVSNPDSAKLRAAVVEAVRVAQ